MSLTNCRFYEEKYPEVDSYVMVNVKQVCIATGHLVLFGVQKRCLTLVSQPLTDRRNGRIR